MISRPAVRSNRVLGKLEHPLLLELRMDDAEDLRLAAMRKPADDQVLADRGRQRRVIGLDRIIVVTVDRSRDDELAIARRTACDSQGCRRAGRCRSAGRSRSTARGRCGQRPFRPALARNSPTSDLESARASPGSSRIRPRARCTAAAAGSPMASTSSSVSSGHTESQRHR